MLYKSLIIFAILSLSNSSLLFPESEESDRLLSVRVNALSSNYDRYRMAVVFLPALFQNEEEREIVSEGILSSKYILLYQGGGILLLFLLIRRLMGVGKKPDIQDKEI